MSFRRRHRWLRRLALGFAAVAAVAAGNASFAYAKIDEGTSDARYVTTPGWSGLVDAESGIPLSAGILAKDAIEGRATQTEPQVIPYLSHGVLSEPKAALPEWQMIPYLSAGRLVETLSRSAVRPDDMANRFAHSDVAPQPESTSTNSWTFERGDVLILVIGTIVLALGLGLALGYLRRPRLAGF